MRLNRRREKNGLDGEGTLTDSLVKYCTQCRRCYEMIKATVKDKEGYSTVYNLTYLTDFPSYGKEKITCNLCLGKPIQMKFKRQTREEYWYGQRK